MKMKNAAIATTVLATLDQINSLYVKFSNIPRYYIIDVLLTSRVKYSHQIVFNDTFYFGASIFKKS